MLQLLQLLLLLLPLQRCTATMLHCYTAATAATAATAVSATAAATKKILVVIFLLDVMLRKDVSNICAKIYLTFFIRDISQVSPYHAILWTTSLLPLKFSN